ncbi:MAG TPA: hypothetical protein VGD52_02350 [Pseudoduganella sp.]
MKRRQTTLLLAAALVLAACAKNDEPAPADQARMMDLMRAIYGAAEEGHVIATLRNGENMSWSVASCLRCRGYDG